MTVPYTFANQSGPIPLSELDVNFANVKAFAITANTVVSNSQPNITSVGILNSLSVSGNITALNLNAVSTATVGYNLSAGNVLTIGFVSAAGNVIGGNIVTAGGITAGGNLIAAIVSATGNINANGNINTPSNINASANVNVGGNVNVTNNVKVSGLISATGNIDVNGNVNSDGNLNVNANISATGSILTDEIMSATGTIYGGNAVIGNNISAYDISAVDMSLSGNIVVAGNAQVNGTTTFINTQNLNVTDKNITIANGAANSTMIDGAGIDAGNPTVAYIRYTDASQGWTTANNFSIGSNLLVNGNAFASTAANGTSNTQLATTKFVDNTIINLNLGTMSIQNANSVNITGGNITGITDLLVADGGTGQSNLTANALLVGNGSSPVAFLSPGNSGNICQSDGTNWITTTNNAFGPGQSYQDVTGSRAVGVTYTNTTGKVIFVIAQVGAQTNGVYVFINGAFVVRHWYDVNGGAGQIGYSTAEFMVGPGDTYLVTGGPLRSWWEYRG